MGDGAVEQPGRNGDPHNSPTRAQVKRWRRYLAEERIEAQTYRNLAKREQGETQQIMLGLAEAEGRHERHWATLLGDHANPPPTPKFTSRLLATLAGRFGSVFALALVQRSEQRNAYETESDATGRMAADERVHGEVVRSLAAASRARMAGNFRAVIFGANDGLISNLALILGVAGAGMGTQWVVTTGVAGLLAGSLSMAAGEWISVSSARELLEASAPAPLPPRSLEELDVNENELSLLFQARGESQAEADARARSLFQAVPAPIQGTPKAGLPQTVGLGLEGSDGGTVGDEIGNPFQVALSSFLSFGLGALVPLLPYLFGLQGLVAVAASAGIVGLVLLFTGGIVGLLSGRVAWVSALRQLAIGYAAATVTFGLGSLLGG